MDFRQLKYFLAVAEEGQITRAAKRLNVTQPPLSQQLIALEKELGLQLIERGKKQLRLTDAGLILQKRARQIMDLIIATENELHEITTGIGGSLAIGTITTSVSSLLPERIKHFHRRYPQVSFHLHQGETSKILELLTTGVIEIGFVRFPVNTDLYNFIMLPDESMVAAARPNYFKTAAGPVKLRQLIGQPLLMHRRHQPLLLEQCRLAGFEPNIFCTSDDITPLLIWANRGLGMAIVPASAQDLLPGSPLTFREITPPAIITTSAVVWAKKHSLSAAAGHFVELFK